MGKIDRLARTIIAAVALLLYFNGIVSGTVGLVLVAVSVIFLLTSLVSFCPLYTLFGLSTNPLKQKQQ